MAYTASQVADAVWTYSTRTLAAGSSTTGTTKAAIIADAVWSYSVRHLTTAMPTYNIQIDDDFNRAITTVGTGANSTTGVGSPASGHFASPSVGGAWIDLVGSTFNLSAPGNLTASGYISNDYDLNYALYRPAVENMIDGRIRVWSTGATGAGPESVIRFTPANGGSGYVILQYAQAGWYGSKKVNGTGAQGDMFTSMTNTFVNGNTAIPSAYVTEVTTSTTGTATTFTMKVYAQTDTTFSNALTSNTYTDTDTTLSAASGAWGTTFFNSAASTSTRVQIANVTSGVTPLTSGSATGSLYKTKARITGTAATGGTGPYTYQWYRSTTSGQNGSVVAGATSLTLADTGLTPATSYWYTLKSTDSAAAFVYSNQATGTTLAANSVMIGFIGDSITYGAQGSTPGSADPVNGKNGVAKELSYLIANSQPAIGFDNGIPGTMTQDWLPASSNLTAAVTTFQNAEITHIQIMLGTNDSGSGHSIPASTYQTNMQSIANSLLSTFPGIKIVINDCPWIDITQSYASAWGTGANPLLQQYRTANAAIANGSTILLGDTASYAFFQSNPTQLFDGVHPNDTGYASLGGLWGTAFKSLLTSVAAVPATALTLTGPSVGYVSYSSAAFLVALSPTGSTSSSVTVTPSSSVAGAFSPTSVALSTATPSATFSFIASAAGTGTVSIANTGSLTNPTASAFSASVIVAGSGVISSFQRYEHSLVLTVGTVPVSIYNLSDKQVSFLRTAIPTLESAASGVNSIPIFSFDPLEHSITFVVAGTFLVVHKLTDYQVSGLQLQNPQLNDFPVTGYPLD